MWFSLLSLALLCTTSLARPSTNCGGKAADVVFVLDSSSSIWEPDFEKQMTFVKDVIGQFDIGMGDSETRVGVVTFGHTYWLQFHLKAFIDRDAMMSAVKEISYKPGYATNTGEAIHYAANTMFTAENGARQNMTRLMIVITDGQSQEEDKTITAAKIAREMDIQIFAIGVGYGADRLELNAIASKPSTNYVFMVDSFDALDRIQQKFASRACEETITTTTPTTTTEATTTKATTTEATTTESTTTEATTTEATTTEATTTPSRIMDDIDPNTKLCGGKPADIYFLLDSSSSIWEQDYKKQLIFVNDIIDVFNISETQTRVGVGIFSDVTEIVVPLDSKLSKGEIQNRVTKSRYIHGGTDTSTAIKYIREEGFAVARQEVAHVLIIVTDGLSRQPEATAAEARALRSKGVYIFAIGVGESIDQKELQNMASTPSNAFVFNVKNYDSLASIKNLLAVQTCSIPNELMSQDENGCRKGTVADVMFVYDPTSLGADKTQHVTDFVAKVSQKMDVVSDNVRVGRMTENCPTNTDVSLSGPESVTSLKSLQLSGFGNLLLKVARRGFSESNGGRPEARSVAVLFLDTDSKDLRSAFHASKHLSDTNMFVVYNENVVDMETALKFVSTPDRLMSYSSYAHLSKLQDNFLKMFCSVLN
ncbi:hypothetical protein ScPMuIL_018165 [Solemya velum]